MDEQAYLAGEDRGGRRLAALQLAIQATQSIHCHPRNVLPLAVGLEQYLVSGDAAGAMKALLSAEKRLEAEVPAAKKPEKSKIVRPVMAGPGSAGS